MKTRITRIEFSVFALLFLLCLASLLLIRRHETVSPPAKVRISQDGCVLGEYPLNEDRTIPIGSTNVCRIEDGKAFMLEASCPDGLCMEQFAPIGGGGGMIICLPNKVVLEGIFSDRPSTENPGAIDAISG